jgi:putative flippase GtrA
MPGPLELRSSMRQFLRDFLAYGLVSAFALGVDLAVLMLLTRQLGVHYLIAATISFVCGAAVAYVLSVRFVFHYHRLAHRSSEFGSFVLLGVVGLIVNAAVIGALKELAGAPLPVAKIGAAGCTLCVNFLLRRQFLFAPKRGSAPQQEHT